MVAPAAGVLARKGVEAVRSARPSLLGGASEAVAGLEALTPAAGVSGPLGAMLLGLEAAIACYPLVARIENRLGRDDSFDVFGIHGVGGIVGCLGTALVALSAAGGHDPPRDLAVQLGRQAAAVAVALACSGTALSLP